jgi:hypothetical protein
MHWIHSYPPSSRKNIEDIDGLIRRNDVKRIPLLVRSVVILHDRDVFALITAPYFPSQNSMAEKMN